MKKIILGIFLMLYCLISYTNDDRSKAVVLGGVGACLSGCVAYTSYKASAACFVYGDSAKNDYNKKKIEFYVQKSRASKVKAMLWKSKHYLPVVARYGCGILLGVSAGIFGNLAIAAIPFVYYINKYTNNK